MIEYIKKLIAKFLAKKSLEDVLSDFHKVKDDLNKFTAHAKEDVTEINKEISALTKNLLSKKDEISRAENIHNNIKKLLGE